MSEVEKLYKNAGVELYYCIYPRYCEAFMNNKCNYDCDFSKSRFTAEKQLELIKWLARFNLRIEYTNAKYFIESHYHGYSVYIECFEQALAGFINTLWQDLTDKDRTEIAEILK